MTNLFVVKDLAEKAIEVAGNMGTELDYSAASIKDLEALLTMVYGRVDAEGFSQDDLWTIACLFGSYLGETMLRNGLADAGFDWQEDTDGEPILVRGGSVFSMRMVPINKVFKRLVNGLDDEIVSFYENSLAMA